MIQRGRFFRRGFESRGLFFDHCLKTCDLVRAPAIKKRPRVCAGVSAGVCGRGLVGCVPCEIVAAFIVAVIRARVSVEHIETRSIAVSVQPCVRVARVHFVRVNYERRSPVAERMELARTRYKRAAFHPCTARGLLTDTVPAGASGRVGEGIAVHCVPLSVGRVGSGLKRFGGVAGYFRGAFVAFVCVVVRALVYYRD